MRETMKPFVPILISLSAVLAPQTVSAAPAAGKDACSYTVDVPTPPEVASRWEDWFVGSISMPMSICGKDPGGVGPLSFEYQARISRRHPNSESFEPWEGTTGVGPTVLFVPGGRSTAFVSEESGDVAEAEHYQAFQRKLIDAGARILEIRFRCAIGPNAADFYEDRGGCMNTFLGHILMELVSRPIPGTGGAETYWPEDQTNRFAWGVSQGQLELMYAIDKAAHPTGVMNRVVYGGGGLIFDLVDRVSCTDDETGENSITCANWTNDGCKVLEAVDFLVPGSDPVASCGGCWGFDDTQTCADRDPTCDDVPASVSCDPDSVEYKFLDAMSVGPHIGEDEDDAERIIGALLGNTGFDLGQNREANREYFLHRDSDGEHGPIDDDNEAMWDFDECICDCPFNSHGPFDKIAELFHETASVDPMKDWIEFFRTGDLVFDFFEDEGLSPEAAPNRERCFGEPFNLPSTFECGHYDIAPGDGDNPERYPACGT